MSVVPKVCVLNAPGINCNQETAEAFAQADASAEQVHISQLNSGERNLDDYQILALPGGFSHGDVVRSGAILGLELRKRHGEQLNRFVEAGKAVMGICNGFQVLVESGLLPDGKIDDTRDKKVALTDNESNKFELRWARLKVVESNCKFVDNDELGETIELPVAHGEGRFVSAGIDGLDLIANGQVPFVFSDESGLPTEEYPDNPNGSPLGITSLCDPEGTVLGMMPHPERFVTRTQHPNWRRGEGSVPFGAIIIKNIVDYARGL